jgi:enoyl-CoA hydratase
VALLRFNRPKQLNALNGQVMDELCSALEALDRDDAIRVLVVTGDERVRRGAATRRDGGRLRPLTLLRTNRIAQWDRVRRIGKPVIAAVAGWCLGGGCELAMALDLIVRWPRSARFGQPEINLGVIPGAGARSA